MRETQRNFSPAAVLTSHSVWGFFVIFFYSDRLSLPKPQTFGTFEEFLELCVVCVFVHLRARAVNGGALAFVEHTHLQCAFVGNQRHLSAQRVYFLDYLSFGGAAYAGIARQKSHRVEICGKHERFAFEFCGGDCRFAACVSRAYYYYVEKIHASVASEYILYHVFTAF